MRKRGVGATYVIWSIRDVLSAYLCYACCSNSGMFSVPLLAGTFLKICRYVLSTSYKLAFIHRLFESRDKILVKFSCYVYKAINF